MAKRQSRYGNPANYNATPATRADGDASALEVNPNGSLIVVPDDSSNFSISQIQGLVSGVETDNILALPGRRADAFQVRITTADATTAVAVKALTASKSIYITDVVISTDTAMNIRLQDGAGSPVVLVGALYMPASSVWSKTFQTPIKVAVATALNVLASLAGNVSVTITGYVL